MQTHGNTMIDRAKARLMFPWGLMAWVRGWLKSDLSPLVSSLNLRAVTINGEPWFVAKDVCDVLDIKNTSQALAGVDPDYKHTQSLGLPGRAPVLINESGLYSLILKSRKPEAKAFKKWVTSEVLPSIRKTGMYLAP
jgi:anti-repressor protein